MGVSDPERPATEIIDFRKGKISLIISALKFGEKKSSYGAPSGVNVGEGVVEGGGVLVTVGVNVGLGVIVNVAEGVNVLVTVKVAV